MKCFYHPAVDAVGLCSKCGKAACSNCISDVGGALLCTDCLEREANYYLAQRKAISILNVVDARKARSRIIGSFVVAAVGFYLGSHSLTTALFFGYIFWAGYWGIPYMWNYWRTFLGRSGCFFIATPIGWLILFALFFYVPIASGMLWGALGGGISEFFKAVRVARNQGAAASATPKAAALVIAGIILLIILSMIGRNKPQYNVATQTSSPAATPAFTSAPSVAATFAPTPSPTRSFSPAIAKAVPAFYRVSGLSQRDVLNVRQGPAATYPVILELRQGEGGISLGSGKVRNGTTVWQEISVRGNKGWANADYLVPETTAP